jgi:hypothetical protein
MDSLSSTLTLVVTNQRYTHLWQQNGDTGILDRRYERVGAQGMIWQKCPVVARDTY